MRTEPTLRRLAVIALVTASIARHSPAAQTPPVFTLSTAGEAQAAIVTAPNASPAVRAAAIELEKYLERISGGDFELTNGDGARDIVIGLQTDFDALPFEAAFTERAEDKEAYLLRTSGQALYIIGATDLGVERGIWDLLYRLGHRHFFASPAWEIVPRKPDVSIAVDAVERPDYIYRKMFYGQGGWNRQGPSHGPWGRHNRMSQDEPGTFRLRTAHSYASIATANEELFAEHPEWLALVNGKRKRFGVSQKFCASNPEFRAFLVRQVLKTIEADPSRECISLEPSDLGHWCECEACAELGSITDQAVTLANDAAAAMADRFGDGKYVGMYAYYKHAPPPNIEVHSNVIVSIATRLTPGYTREQLLEGWSEKASILGMREYWSVYQWDRSLPGKGSASGPGYMAQTLPEFFNRYGVRFMTAEASQNWGAAGLGYYLAARFMWDTEEAGQIDRLIDDFLVTAFGPAADTMRRFYQAIDAGAKPVVNDEMVVEMYRLLATARTKAAENQDILERLKHLVLFTRYTELYLAYAGASEAARQEAFGEFMRFSWRIGGTGIVDTIASWRQTARRDKTVFFPDGTDVRAADSPWKDRAPFSDAEIDAMIAARIKANSGHGK